MRNKIFLFSIFGIALFFFSLSYFFAGYSVCLDYPWACTESFIFLRRLSFVLSIPILLITPLLFFFKKEVRTAWFKFFSVGLPLMFAVLLYTSTYPGSASFGPNYFEIAMVLAPALFIILSIGIIVFRARTLKKGSSTRKK